MNKFIFPLFAIVLICLFGCRKPDNTPGPGACICKLTSIDDQVSDYSVFFEYDSLGRLEYRRASYETRLSPDYKFIYDRRGRLSQYITNGGSYSVGSRFYEWHYLYYDSRGRITKDTLFSDGVIGPDGPVFDPMMPPGYNRSAIEYEYDSRNRMVRRTTPGNSSTYTYNAQGNLVTNVYGDSLHYDNKVNFNRTDPILQFINRDYSANNPLGASSYNAYSLPLEYLYVHGSTSIIIDYMGFYHPIFTYRCK